MSLGGGSGGSSSKSGYSALPKELQQAFNPLGVQLAKYTNPANAGVNQMFTPMAQTHDETNAFSAMRGGFTPTAESLNSDISMLMNPFDTHVIDEINRQGQGEFSVLKQAMGQAGQLGSNRSMLGANDIDLSRMNQIGGFKQNQYNQALNQVFNNLVPQRQQDAQNLMGIGTFERGLDTQTRQAPINALQAGTSMLGPFVSGGTSTSKGATDPMGDMGKIAQVAAMIFKSDRRLKENIIPVGVENGYPIYEFNYAGLPQRFIGVMADEVPDAAVSYADGYAHVDYQKIGVRFREVSNGNV